MNLVLTNNLFFASIIICFIALINISIRKKPFSKILVRCVTSIGVLFLLASIIYPRISGYVCSGFDIFSNGSFVLIDGLLFLMGILGVLFARIMKYGFMYQSDTENTI